MHSTNFCREPKCEILLLFTVFKIPPLVAFFDVSAQFLGLFVSQPVRAIPLAEEVKQESVCPPVGFLCAQGRGRFVLILTFTPRLLPWENALLFNGFQNAVCDDVVGVHEPSLCGLCLIAHDQGGNVSLAV